MFFASNAYASTLLTKDLKLGSQDSEVIILQKFLNSFPDTRVSESGNGSSGSETNFFGQKTKSAVMKFQSKYAADILTPAKLTSPSGFVGSLTRAKINSLIKARDNQAASPAPAQSNPILDFFNKKNNTITNEPTPFIRSISPVILKDGGILTIKGSGFSASNTVFLSIEPLGKYASISSTASGTEITLPINTDLGKTVMDSLRQNLENIPSELHEKIINNIVQNFKQSNGQVISSTTDRQMLVSTVVHVENDAGRSNDAIINIDIYKDLQ